MENTRDDENLGYLKEFIEKSGSKEDICEWLKCFDHFKCSDFAVYFFSQINSALERFRESETVELTRIKLQNVTKIVPEIKPVKPPQASQLDVSDNQDFPPLGSVETSKNSGTKKRITPRRISTKGLFLS